MSSPPLRKPPVFGFRKSKIYVNTVGGQARHSGACSVPSICRSTTSSGTAPAGYTNYRSTSSRNSSRTRRRGELFLRTPLRYTTTCRRVRAVVRVGIGRDGGSGVRPTSVAWCKTTLTGMRRNGWGRSVVMKTTTSIYTSLFRET